MPVQYSSILGEHHAVRTASGLFDISHMGEVRVSGGGATQSLNALLTNDVRHLAVGEAQYSLMCNERGGVIDDLYVYRTGDATYLLVINASHINKDIAWMRSHLDGPGVTVEDLSAQTSALALQGPRALTLFEQLKARPAVVPSRNHTAEVNLLGHDALIARTGYTGEDGLELFLRDEAVLDVWRRLLDLGAVPCGLGARDTLRLEMCYPLHGNDLSEETTPIEAGLAAFVGRDKPRFIGKEILQQQREMGTEKRLVAFRMNERGAIPRPHCSVMFEGRQAGEVTSGTMSPSLQIGIGMGYVNSGLAQIGNSLEIEIRGRNPRATIVKKPFYRR